MQASIHTAPAGLSKALGRASKRIKAISYEYPGTWLIETAQDTYLLGDAGGEIGWHIESGAIGGELPDSSEFTAPRTIALAFAKWLQKVEGN